MHAASIRIQGRPGAAPPSPGRPPAPAAARALPAGPSARAPLPVSGPEPTQLARPLPTPSLLPLGAHPGNPFLVKRPRPNAAAFRGDSNRVIKFGGARKCILPGSNLVRRREWNRRAAGLGPGRWPWTWQGLLQLRRVLSWGHRGVGGPFPLQAPLLFSFGPEPGQHRKVSLQHSCLVSARGPLGARGKGGENQLSPLLSAPASAFGGC